MTGASQFRFEDFVLDIDRRELRRGSELAPLEPQVFDLLVYVIRNRDRVVSKDDLIEAVWGGRIVSESSLTTRLNAARKAIGDSGEEQRLIRTVARKGIRFVGEARESAGDATSTDLSPEPPALALPDKPSIAVLPFQNMSDDPSQDYFCDGMVEEIITALSRFHWLFVIARNSSFTYKGKSVDVRQIGRDLGVRYILEGSVRKAGQKVRINGQLVDAATGAHLWADKFDGNLADVFDLQDQIAARVVSAIEPKLQTAEIERAKRKPAENLHAYDLYLRALPGFYAGTRDGMAEALGLLYRAIDADPKYAAAYGRASQSYIWRSAQGWFDSLESRNRELAEAVRLARAAIEINRDDPEAMAGAGWVLVYCATDVDLGLGVISRALAQNPNYAQAWIFSGSALIYTGDTETATGHLLQARRLSPRDPLMYLILSLLAFAHMFAGRFAEAIDYAKQSLLERSHFTSTYRVLAASYLLLGQEGEAREAVRLLLQLDPGCAVRTGVGPRTGMRQHPKSDMYHDALRRLGLPVW